MNKVIFMVAITLALCEVFISSEAQAAVVPLPSFNRVAHGLNVDAAKKTKKAASFKFNKHSTDTSLGEDIAKTYLERNLGPLGLGLNGKLKHKNPPAGRNAPNVPWGGAFKGFAAADPKAHGGMSKGEKAAVKFGYGGTLATLLDAINHSKGNARIAAQALKCTGGKGCGAASAVPIPGAVWLMSSALLGIGIFIRRSKLRHTDSIPV